MLKKRFSTRPSHSGVDLTLTASLRRACAVGWVACLVCVSSSPVRAAEPARLAFDVAAEPAIRELSPEFCWFHPRAAAIPGAGKDGMPAVVMTLMKHLAADDHYSGLYCMRTDDLGRTWTRPVAIPELAWRKQAEDITVAVIDTTPGWHARSGKLLVIGAKILYTASGNYGSLEKMPRSYETSYATYDPVADRWSGWRELDMPEADGKFFRVGCGCSQWLVKPDGTLLVPVQFQPKQGGDYLATVLHCSFDGTEMKYLRHGTELSIAGGRGFTEPSLALFQGKYFLTLRNDARGYVATSDDGLEFGAPRAWTFDDGKDLGSYNTQAHWLTHADGLFLSYTRRGANNDHIARHRAPLFVAQVDPQSLQVVRSTERVLLPERGVMLGNFGASAITANESWVTDAEFISRLVDPNAGTRPHPKGADGTVWVGRVKWSKPNSLAVASIAGESQPVAQVPADRGEGTKTIVTVAASTPEFTRKGEGDVIELQDGRLMLAYMEFSGTGSDEAKTRFVIQESADHGKTWSGHRLLAETAPGDMNVYSPNLIRAKDGGILLIFMRQHHTSPLTSTLHAWKSTDEGRTSKPWSVFGKGDTYSVCNAVVKRLKSGRLLLPVTFTPKAGTGYGGVVLLSDDDGLTWREAKNRIFLPLRGVMEPHVEQAGDGRVLMVMRNQLGSVQMSESSDEGVSWTEPKSTGLKAPESCPELTRIPSTGDLLMIWNNTFDPNFRSHYGKRSPLTAAVSKDHGRTWQHVRDIETDPKRAFSNPGCRFTRAGRAILNYWTCEYLPDWRMQDIIDLRVAVIDTAWFYESKTNAP
ncbi:MAG: exo-alpha-sialidase [Pirellulales bacterium]|nr:exo-alpha-sialidase [Pirellulales bacterium]